MSKEGLRNLGFDIPGQGKVTTQQAIMLNRVEKELHSTPDAAKVDDIELQQMTENTARSTENLIVQLEDESPENLRIPVHELLDLDKQFRSIRGLLYSPLQRLWVKKNCGKSGGKE